MKKNDFLKRIAHPYWNLRWSRPILFLVIVNMPNMFIINTKRNKQNQFEKGISTKDVYANLQNRQITAMIVLSLELHLILWHLSYHYHSYSNIAIFLSPYICTWWGMWSQTKTGHLYSTIDRQEVNQNLWAHFSFEVSVNDPSHAIIKLAIIWLWPGTSWPCYHCLSTPNMP